MDLWNGIAGYTWRGLAGNVGTTIGGAAEIIDYPFKKSGTDPMALGPLGGAEMGMVEGMASLGFLLRGFAYADDLAIAAKATPSFFEGTTYTPKVLKQASRGAGEFHSFPESIAAFESSGTVRTLTGVEKEVQVLEIPGSYMTPSAPGVPGKWYDGVFQWMKDPDNTINHRLFVPNPP